MRGNERESYPYPSLFDRADKHIETTMNKLRRVVFVILRFFCYFKEKPMIWYYLIPYKDIANKSIFIYFIITIYISYFKNVLYMYIYPKTNIYICVSIVKIVRRLSRILGSSENPYILAVLQKVIKDQTRTYDFLNLSTRLL